MHLSRINFFTQCSLSIGLLIFAASAFAQQFTPPEQLTQSGKVYKLAYKNTSPNGRAIYEYTTDGEPIEKWTTLVTLNYAKGQRSEIMQWAAALQTALDSEKPKPHYAIYTKANIGYAGMIYEPVLKTPLYESNVHKLFNREECGGTLVYQFAVNYPQGADQSDAGKLATLVSIKDENKKLSQALEQSDWSPTCR